MQVLLWVARLQWEVQSIAQGCVSPCLLLLPPLAHGKGEYWLACNLKTIASLLLPHVVPKAVALIDVVEWQKRGLPYAHMLLILQDADKLRTVEDSDSVVQAYLPDQQEHPRLFEAVQKYMVHGPCGLHNPKCPCMDNGRCSKHFPKDFSNETMQSIAEHSRTQQTGSMEMAASYAYLEHGISTGLWEEHHLQVGHKLESWHWRKCTPNLL